MFIIKNIYVLLLIILKFEKNIGTIGTAEKFTQ